MEAFQYEYEAKKINEDNEAEKTYQCNSWEEYDRAMIEFNKLWDMKKVFEKSNKNVDEDYKILKKYHKNPDYSDKTTYDKVVGIIRDYEIINYGDISKDGPTVSFGILDDAGRIRECDESYVNEFTKDTNCIKKYCDKIRSNYNKIIRDHTGLLNSHNDNFLKQFRISEIKSFRIGGLVKLGIIPIRDTHAVIWTCKFDFPKPPRPLEPNYPRIVVTGVLSKPKVEPIGKKSSQKDKTKNSPEKPTGILISPTKEKFKENLKISKDFTKIYFENGKVTKRCIIDENGGEIEVKDKNIYDLYKSDEYLDDFIKNYSHLTNKQEIKKTRIDYFSVWLKENKNIDRKRN